ncbi:phosphinothricin acetyltransferase [Catalinimonas alkaloidigena]|uniref:Phosphinothricin acetyltransferase n=1 Tax=Catalinimonas alkaloidigena TaxID=1075417 RepID=A0A1G8YG64_9BACT|nr:GNAT family N-acetyltransferase [Catalinimonas alkaloidigena]SDK01693.1 phosphinothricin acetyltransferase [Catalinimonas alkaloidigena]
MEVSLRAAAAEDLPNIVEIINDAILHTSAVYDYHPRSLETQHAWWLKKQADGMPVVVADHERRAIGFGTYGIFRPWDAYRFSVEHSLYVADSFRGQGVGKLLLGRLIALATAQGFHTMIAGIDGSNAGSYALHRKFGFEEIGRFREIGYKFDRWLDLIFMQRFLQTPASKPPSASSHDTLSHSSQ